MKQIIESNLRCQTFARVALALLLACPLIGYAQDKRPQTKQYQTAGQIPGEQPTASSPLVISPNEDYLIGPSDVIEVKVEDAPELSGVYRLNSGGTFILPVIGQVSANAKRTEEVSSAIAEKLRGRYLINPLVTVLVRQSNSRAFFIQGAVRRPGIYQIEGRPSLLKLITIAGGLADNYGSTAFVMREKPSRSAAQPLVNTGTVNENESSARLTVKENELPAQNEVKTESAVKTTLVADRSPGEAEINSDSASGEEKYELMQANINNLLRGNLEQNISIQPGDIVHIPQSDVFFVAGEVKAPGSFPLKDGTTLRQAISLAQGATFEGATDRGVIFREDRTGKREEIAVNIGAVMSGKNNDVEIMPNDIIIIPNSKKKAVAKTLMQSFSSTVPGILLRTMGVW